MVQSSDMTKKQLWMKRELLFEEEKRYEDSSSQEKDNKRHGKR